MQNERDFRTGLAGVALVVCLAAGAAAAAQTPAAPAQTPAAPATPPPDAAPAPDPGAAPDQPYTYQQDSRRDPFVSLVARGTEPTVSTGAIPGIGGLTTAEIAVSGILQKGSTIVAMLQGADTRTHIAHVNDRLLDGVITQITQQGVVILQEVNDPLSLVKQREVRKNLRSLEEAQ
jgi:Tfp pilus assembly protein PilP